MSLPYDFSLYSDGVVVPLGPGIDTKVTNPRGYTLNYNGECVAMKTFIGHLLYSHAVYSHNDHDVTILSLFPTQSMLSMMCLK